MPTRVVRYSWPHWWRTKRSKSSAVRPPCAEFVLDELLEFISRHGLVKGDAEDDFGKAGGGSGGDIDLVVLHFGFEQESLGGVTFDLLLLVLAVGPFAGTEAEEEASFAFGGEEVVAVTGWPSIEPKSAETEPDPPMPPRFLRLGKVGGKRNYRGHDDNDPEPLLVPADCANHTSILNYPAPAPRPTWPGVKREGAS